MDPLSNAMEQEIKKKLALFECVRMVLVNHVAGKPSLLAVDAGRKMLPMDNKPTFATLDSWINKLITAGGQTEKSTMSATPALGKWRLPTLRWQ